MFHAKNGRFVHENGLYLYRFCLPLILRLEMTRKWTYLVDEDFSNVEEVNTEKLQELIKKHDESFDDKTGDLLNSKVYFASKQQIRATIGAASVEAVNESIKALLERIEELEEKFKNHRHELSKTYSGRPET